MLKFNICNKSKLNGNFYQAVDKAVCNGDIDGVVSYSPACIGDFQDNLFFRIYLNEFDKKLIFSN